MKRFSKALAAIMLMTAVFFTSECMYAQTYEGHEYVDLGLPSGTLWATCNIGADKPEDNGDYFAWGETETKGTYNWETYRYANGDYDKLTKYCSMSDYGDNGFTDNRTTLQASDDPAAVSWGNGWHTPTVKQWKELLDNTTNQWITKNGVKGRLFTAKNGKTLFLPAAGLLWGSELDDVGFDGSYWSRSLITDEPSYAFVLRFSSFDCVYYFMDYRSRGLSVRPVR